jgi:DNA polymerase-3 subunit gamma/tau
MRDALSLLDQSISYGNGSVKEEDLKEMLGLVNHNEIVKLAKLINNRDAEKILSFVKDLAHKGENLASALRDLTSIFHQISIAQIIQDKNQMSSEIADLANSFSAQDLQLYYQIAINGQKDMNLSPSEQIGLEMTLLRMIAFHPDYDDREKKNLKPTPNKKSKVIDTATPKESPESSSNLRDPNEEINKLDIKNQKEWEDIIKTFDFNGAGKMLVKNTVFKSLENQTLVLTLSSDFLNLLTPKTEDSIRNGLHKQYPAVELIFEPGETNGDSLSQKESVEREQKRKETESQFLSDDGLKELQEVFNSKVDLKSIKSIKESDNV